MLRLLHHFAKHGWVYDRIQDLAGAREVYRRLGRHLAATRSPYWLLDVGGGTGRTRRLLSDDARYVCLDVEGPKLAHLHRTGRAAHPYWVTPPACRFELRQSMSSCALTCLTI